MQLRYCVFHILALVSGLVSSEAKGDGLIGVHQTQFKIERMLMILTSALSCALSGFGNTSILEKRLTVPTQGGGGSHILALRMCGQNG